MVRREGGGLMEGCLVYVDVKCVIFWRILSFVEWRFGIMILLVVSE